ncbi:hypothetical protein [Streptomyces sp. NPDC052012]|uniref:hypothetical protein n=1 Tax=Streptomyces sp. NPDC052012 TaxID=3155051 RepID=UPI0034506B58
MSLGGVLAVIAGCACVAVACGYRRVDMWVWDWADATFTRRTRWGTPWKTPGRMRTYFGGVGVALLVSSAVTLVQAGSVA